MTISNDIDSLDSLSTEELKKLLRVTEDEAVRFKIKQESFKVLINGCYGAFGNAFFQYFDVENAEAVTITGKIVIKWIIKRINKYLNKLLKTTDENYVIAADTDSCYIDMDKLIRKYFPDLKESFSQETEETRNRILSFVDKLCNEVITPFMNKCYVELFEYMNHVENLMVMKREVIADAAVWTAKKQYMMNVWDSEGVRYDEPKIKIVGIDIVKSNLPAVCREKLEECAKIILNGSEEQLVEKVEAFRKEFQTLPVEAIASPRGVNSVDGYEDDNGSWIKGTPIHSKGAILYNSLIKEANLPLPPIRDSDKIKFIYLTPRNPFGCNVISFPDKLPDELGLNEYVDKNTQFEKTFLSTLTRICKIIGWKAEKTDTLF